MLYLLSKWIYCCKWHQALSLYGYLQRIFMGSALYFKFASIVSIWDTDAYCCVLVQWSQFSDSSLIKQLDLSLEFLLKFNEKDRSSERPRSFHHIFTCFGVGGCNFLMSEAESPRRQSCCLGPVLAAAVKQSWMPWEATQGTCEAESCLLLHWDANTSTTASVWVSCRSKGSERMKTSWYWSK